MKRIVRFKDAEGVLTTLEIELENKEKGLCFSMTGEHAGSAGQCYDSIKPRTASQKKLLEYWSRYHLNDMNAGTLEQEQALKSPGFLAFWNRAKEKDPCIDHYAAACAYLKKKKLYKVFNAGKLYTYGTAWLYSPLPENFIDTIEKLCQEIEKDEPRAWGSPTDEFMKATGTTFSAEFIKYAPYFEDDTASRDIYKITLTRGARSFSFNFGQSLQASGRFWKFNNYKRGVYPGYFSKIQQKWCTPSEPSSPSSDWTRNKDFAAPSAYDVFACLQKSDPGTFAQFCADFGYDQDSKKAERMYKGVCEEWKNLQALYNDEEITSLQDIN